LPANVGQRVIAREYRPALRKQLADRGGDAAEEV
jgi:hypothetical protein